jgi:lysozyme family protein
MTFDIAVNRILDFEKGYSNDPNDPGLETNWGISRRYHPTLDIRNLTREDARELYFREYWMPLKNLTISDTVRYQLFDFAVHSGVNQAIKSYLKVYLTAKSDLSLIALIIAERMHYLNGLPSWKDFSRGWTERVLRNLQFAATDLE